MLRHLLSGLQRVVSRLKEPRVFQLNPEPEWHISALRWTTLVFYGWLGAVVVYLLWPWLSYLRPERLFSLEGHSALYGLLQISWSLVAVILVLTLQDKFFIRFPRKRRSSYCIDIQTFLRYPTLHVSVVTGIAILLSVFNGDLAAEGSSLLVISSEMLRFPVSVMGKDTRLLPVLSGDGLGVFFCLYLLVTFLRTEFQKKQTEGENDGAEVNETLDLLTCTDDQFEKWITQERDEKTLDFFDREPYIARMLERIQPAKNKTADKEVDTQRSKGQVLLGEFGSGKTTIVNLLEKELDPEWIVSRFDCWQRSGKPEELAAQLMEQIIHDVGQQFEVASLVGLPESFASALYGSSHWWQLLDIWLRPDTPEQVIERLDNLLKVNNRKLLLVVENVDRNEEREHFVNIIAAILDKLQQSKNLNHIDFIFSADEARLDEVRLDKELLYRIADYKEYVDNDTPPEVILRFMALCLNQTLGSGKNGGALILPYLSKDFQLPEISKSGKDAEGVSKRIAYMAEAFAMTPYDEESSRAKTSIQPAYYQLLLAFAEVLLNPRKLKNILRRAYGLWNESLKGEVHLFDLLLYCASIEDGELKNLIKGSASEILEGKFNGKRLFSSPLIDKLDEKNKEDQSNSVQSTGKADLVINLTDPQGQKSTASAYINQQTKTVDIDQSPKMTSDAGEQNARAQLAFYILNGDLPGNHPERSPRCQPFIEENGKSESAYRKYKSALRRGFLGANISSDQEFLRNYINASDGDQQALKACLNFALSSSHNLVIFERLLDTMTRKYFSSVTQLYQFTYHAIVLADQRYASTMNGVLNPLIRLCFKVVDFDASEGESNANNLQEKLTTALKELAEHKQYSYLLRTLLFIASSKASDLALRVINTVAKSVFTREFSNRMADAFKKNEAGTHELQYEYISLLPALKSVLGQISADSDKSSESDVAKETLREACHSFLIAIGEKLQDDPKILSQFAQRYSDPLSEIKQAIENALRDEALEGIELNAWDELMRVLPDAKNTDDSQPQDK